MHNPSRRGKPNGSYEEKGQEEGQAEKEGKEEVVTLLLPLPMAGLLPSERKTRGQPRQYFGVFDRRSAT
jgi:hypothetical protein